MRLWLVALALLAQSACARHVVSVYPLSHERAADLAEVIDSLHAAPALAGVAAAERTEQLVVRATPGLQDEIASLIATLDVPGPEAEPALLVLHLQAQRAERVAPVLRELWPDAARVVADSHGNALILRARPEQLRVMRSLVEQLDVPPEGME